MVRSGRCRALAAGGTPAAPGSGPRITSCRRAAAASRNALPTVVSGARCSMASRSVVGADNGGASPGARPSSTLLAPRSRICSSVPIGSGSVSIGRPDRPRSIGWRRSSAASAISGVTRASSAGTVIGGRRASAAGGASTGAAPCRQFLHPAPPSRSDRHRRREPATRCNRLGTRRRISRSLRVTLLCASPT